MFSPFRLPFQAAHSQSPVRLIAHLLTVGYLALISLVSSLPGAGLVFFPELAALAFDGFVRPRGTWASVPGFVAFTPVLTAVAGVAVTNWMPFGVPAILLVTSICVLTVQLLRSPVAPAISAGVLPVMTGLESWWYPPAVLFGTGFLALSLIGWKRIAIPHLAESPAGVRDQIDDQMERIPRRWNWIPMLIIFVSLVAGLVQITGERMILFPPLVVIAFEMFAHPHICPWVRRPARFPLATFFAATVGVWAVLTFGAGVPATVISLVAGILILKIFDLHMPPALAIGLIPQILDEPGWNYPVSVLTGSAVLAVSFYLYRILLRGGINQNTSPRTENT